MSNPDIKVYDNFLQKDAFNNINQAMTSPVFPWYFIDSIVTETDQERKDIRMFQFIHVFFNRIPLGETFRLMDPLIQKINPSAILRIKANLLPHTETVRKNGFHTDYYHSGNYENAKTAIYYVNTNNGKTVFEDGTEVDSVANRLVVFNPNIKHTGTTCSNQKCRIVINFNYYNF